ncbi:MAG: 4Fe-4S dicluster domain-containing protein [Chloroflexota bacterium]|nr:MAG: 4Fe-4S dicluster domain-containing protein [Chloroflexota bacterium]
MTAYKTKRLSPFWASRESIVQLVIDYQKCTGCKTCTLACSLHHTQSANPALSRIYVYHSYGEGVDIPMVCMQCARPACEAVCPVKAITRQAATGAMVINDNACIGCRMCEMSCPFGMIFRETNSRRMMKCDLCEGDPQCVKFCQTKAIQYVGEDSGRFQRRIVASQRMAEALSER